MRSASFAEIEPELIAQAHRIAWSDMATVGPDDRPRTRLIHPIWSDGVAWITSLRVGPKADAINRNPYVSLAYVADSMRPAYAACIASWENNPAKRREIWERLATIPEPLGYDTKAMFGSYDFPHLTMLRLVPWKIRLTVAGDRSALRVCQTADSI